MSVTVREYVGPRSYRGCPVRGAAVNDDRYALAFVVVCVVLVVWAFVAPHRVFRLTEAEAIAQQRAVAKMRGVEYATDAEALDDFMATHWAWLEEE